MVKGFAADENCFVQVDVWMPQLCPEGSVRQIMAVLRRRCHKEGDFTLWVPGHKGYMKFLHNTNYLLHFISIQCSLWSRCVNRNALPLWPSCFFLPLNDFNMLINNDFFNAFSLVHIKYIWNAVLFPYLKSYSSFWQIWIYPEIAKQFRGMNGVTNFIVYWGKIKIDRKKTLLFTNM